MNWESHPNSRNLSLRHLHAAIDRSRHPPQSPERSLRKAITTTINRSILSIRWTAPTPTASPMSRAIVPETMVHSSPRIHQSHCERLGNFMNQVRKLTFNLRFSDRAECFHRRMPARVRIIRWDQEEGRRIDRFRRRPMMTLRAIELSS